MGLLIDDFDALFALLELFSRDIELPIDLAHEKAFKLVHIFKGHAADLSDVLVGVVGVIEHLRDNEH